MKFLEFLKYAFTGERKEIEMSEISIDELFGKMYSKNMLVRKMNPNAIIPKYQTDGSAGMDLHACIEVPITIKPGEIITINSGLAFKIPYGFFGSISSRSGLASKGVTVPNGIAIIDSDYRGEVRLSMVNLSATKFTINPNDRICQMCILPVNIVGIVEIEEENIKKKCEECGENCNKTLDELWYDTERGTKGFGSTGMT